MSKTFGEAQHIVQRCIRADFIQKSPNQMGGFDYYVSRITADYLRQAIGAEVVPATNEGRETPLDFSHYGYMLKMDDKTGLLALMGGKAVAREVMESVEKLMKADPAFVDETIADRNAQAQGHVDRYLDAQEKAKPAYLRAGR
jgi:hypothetical protein